MKSILLLVAASLMLVGATIAVAIGGIGSPFDSFDSTRFGSKCSMPLEKFHEVHIEGAKFIAS